MILSITIGTHFIHGAIFDGSQITRIPESCSQSNLFPTCVYLDESGELLFGEEAESKRHYDPTRYRRELKRYLGQDTPIILGDHNIMTEELFVALFKYLKSEAKKAIAKEVDTIVIALCATDGEYRQSVIEKVAKTAGFSKVTMISEAIASAHYYEYENKDSFSEGDIILVYDLGGSIFSATLIQKKGQTFKLLAQPIVDNNLGGANFDRLIYKNFIDKHGKNLGDLLERQDKEAYKTRLEIANQCRDIKHYLSQKTEYQGTIKDYADYILSRQEFENMVWHDLETASELCRESIKDAGLDSDRLSGMLMVGGSCHIPYIFNVLKQEFQQLVLTTRNPELAACYGAIFYIKKSSFLEKTEFGIQENTVNNLASNNIPKTQPSIQSLVWDKLSQVEEDSESQIDDVWQRFDSS